MKLVKLDAQIEETLDEINNRVKSLRSYYKLKNDTGWIVKSIRKRFIFDIRVRIDALDRAENEGKFD